MATKKEKEAADKAAQEAEEQAQEDAALRCCWKPVRRSQWIIDSLLCLVILMRQSRTVMPQPVPPCS